ncbi:protoporphyrinogen oxidase [gut metagenome]|uniref:peptide chain release factor N(5)-glutamine methyltransferase n=1 Tax=gut metagenome TaxID=749906 RepID=J9G3H7_9ZZZZ
MSPIATYICNRLHQSYSRQEALALTRIVCCEMLGQRVVDFYVGKDIILSSKEEAELDSILSRLLKFEPVQYIQGEVRFFGRTFKVASGVLIPRPETEELVEVVLTYLSPAAHILDIGTGSGCIAVTLSKEVSRSEVTAWDISEQALTLAYENNLLLGGNVRFEQHDVLQYKPDEKAVYDAIVSNPPYVLQKERMNMEHNVLDWEPELALFVPDDDPLLFYRHIAQLGLHLLKPTGRIFFEINRAFGQLIVEMLLEMGYSTAEVKKDISGNDRIVIAER